MCWIILLSAAACGQHVLNFQDLTEQHKLSMSCWCDVMWTDVQEIKKKLCNWSSQCKSLCSIVLKCSVLVGFYTFLFASFVISGRLCNSVVCCHVAQIIHFILRFYFLCCHLCVLFFVVFSFGLSRCCKNLFSVSPAVATWTAVYDDSGFGKIHRASHIR